MRVLVDTSVWIAHLKHADPRLQALLRRGAVVVHPMVVGEMACGRLARRGDVLGLLQRLPALDVVSHGEAMAFVEAHDVPGTGVGWVDIHLLAAALVAGARLWTRDRPVEGVATSLRIAY